MPYFSKRQQRWGHTAAGQKALGGKAAVQEWDSATDFRHLPERKAELGMPMGRKKDGEDGKPRT